MRVTAPAFLSVMVGLVGGNFAFQSLMDNPEYGVAVERSFFQVTALLSLFLVALIGRWLGMQATEPQP